MSKRTGLWVMIAALVASPALGWAAEHGGKAMGKSMGSEGAKWTLSLTSDYTASPWTSEVGYTTRAVGKLGFGVKNLLLGWVDLFTEPKEAMDSGEGFLKGLGAGLKDAVENTLGGAVHLVTFPITAIDAPLPEGGTQLL